MRCREYVQEEMTYTKTVELGFLALYKTFFLVYTQFEKLAVNKKNCTLYPF